MAKYPMFISYYTKSHEHSAAALLKSLNKFNLPNNLVLVPDMTESISEEDKRWAETCKQRCTFIHDMLDDYEQVVWLDSDTEVIREPELFSNMTDMYHIGVSMRPCGVLGGVIWANKSSRWFWKMVESISLPDEDARTSAAISKCRNDDTPLNIYPIPISYQYVPWLMHLESKLSAKEVFIVHLMAHSKEVHDAEWAKWHRGI